MNNRIIVDTDIEVVIVEIKQYLTYRNLLEGVPNSRLNKIIIERTIDEAKELFDLKEIYFIEPTMKPIEYDGEYPFGNTEALPEITCLVKLRYPEAFKDKNMDYSCLCLLWFQDDYAFPIEKSIIYAIMRIPYRKICEEFSYDDM